MELNNIITKYIDCSKLDDKLIMDISDIDYGKSTILIVDDSNAVIHLLKRLIKKIKLSKYFNVVYATDNLAAFKVINTLCKNPKFNIDLVITDITFGGSMTIDNKNYSFSGIELVGILKDINPDLVYRFITGHSVSNMGTPEFFKEFEEYNNIDDLMDYIEFKDNIITTNISLIKNLLDGTKYEYISKKI